jgi:hypothetical protein
VSKIYVDGCSYVYGQGLDRQHSLANLLSINNVDMSCTGKSNYAIALDLYASKLNCDIYIIGWTFSNRTEFNFDNNIIQSSSSRTAVGLGDIPNGEYLENEYKILQDKFYRYSSRQDVLSDFFIDATASMLTKQNKKFIFISWENRNCQTSILYPNITSNYRQKDTATWKTTGHLTKEGMLYLADLIKGKLNE